MANCQHPHHHHPEHGERAPVDRAALVAGCIHKLRGLGMRRTRLLEDVLAEFARREIPITIAMLGEAIGAVCDPASLYRMVERLVDAGVVRKIGLQERALFYELVLPDRHRDYLICQSCGAIGDINEACPVDRLQEELARRTGYSGLRHELIFYGICPECRSEATEATAPPL